MTGSTPKEDTPTEPRTYRERLYEVFTDGGADPADRIDTGLEIGTEYLDVSIGFLTRIEEEVQQVVKRVGGGELLQEGDTCSIEEAYCQRTIEVDGALSVQAAGAETAIPDRAFESFGLQTYVGAEVRANDDLYGTVCFADAAQRDAPFTESEELFVEILAKLIGQTLERHEYAEQLNRRNERLRAQKRRFERIAETSSDIIFRLDSDVEFTYVSAAAERLLGYDPESLIGEPVLDVVPSETADRARRLTTTAMGGDDIEGATVTLETADGERRRFEINATRVEDIGEGEPGLQGIARDVTAREERRRTLRMRNRAMDEAEMGIVIADATTPDTPLIYVNDGFCEITGYDREEALGRNCRFLQGDGTAPDRIRKIREAIDAGDSVQVDLLNYRNDGSRFWNRLGITPVTDETGEIVRFIGFQQDVTERRRRQRLLAVMNRVLRHNLRNKMNVLLGRLEGADETGATAETTEAVETTARELLEIADQARELYNVARADRTATRIDPTELIADLVESFEAEHPGATFEVVIDAEQDIAAGPSLQRAVAELFENAIEHDPASEPTIEVTVEDVDGEVRLRVADDGEGITDVETRVVDAGRESPLVHGSGLGLWLVNWIVTDYGGEFDIRCRPGEGREGTVATVTLPGVSPDEAVSERARSPTVLGH